jgi:hypothetical protein
MAQWPPPGWDVAPPLALPEEEGFAPEPVGLEWPPPEWGDIAPPTAMALQPEPEPVVEAGSWPPPEWALPVVPGLLPDDGPAEPPPDLGPGQPPQLGGTTLRPQELALPAEVRTPAEVTAPIPEDPAELERMRVDAFEGLAPEEQAEVVARDRADREEHVRQLREQKLEADRAQQAENIRTRDTARAEADRKSADLVARAKELATKQDPDRWWKSRSTGQKIASYLSAIIGGYLSPLRGGKNEGLQMILDEIDRDIEAQRFDIAKETEAIGLERGEVSAEYARASEQFADRESMRLASLQQLDNQLALEAGKYRPDGARALRIAGARAQVRSAQQEQFAKAQDEMFNRELELQKLKQRDVESRRQAGVAYAGIRESREAREQAAEERAKDRAATEAQEAQLPPLTTLHRKDGTKATTGDAAVDKEIGERHAAGEMLDNALGQLYDHIRVAENAQGIIDWGRLESSQAKQKTRQLQNALKFAALQAVGSKTISERTLPALEDIFGGDLTELSRTDPVTEIRDLRRSLYSNHATYVRRKLGDDVVVDFRPLEGSELGDALREQHDRGGLPLPPGMDPLEGRPQTEGERRRERRRRDFPFGAD